MIRDSGVTRTMCVAGESRTGQTVLLESPEPRQSVVLCNFTCLLLSELDSLCKWLHGKAAKGKVLRQLPPQQLTQRESPRQSRDSCGRFHQSPPSLQKRRGNSHPSNSHSESHRGEAETAVADFTLHPPPSKLSYLEGVLKFDCIEAKPRQHDLGLGGRTR